MKRSFLIITFILVGYITGCAQGTDTKTDSYTITINPDNLRLISVSAEIHVEDQQISMNWPSGNSVEKGWSHFVEGLEVFDSRNKPIQYEYVDTARWKLKSRKKKVKINYNVRLDHDKVAWNEGGHSAASYVLEDVFFSIGAALFISTDSDLLADRKPRPTTITFNLPDRFDVAIPWKQSSMENNLFEVATTYELVRTGMMIGKFPKQVKTVSNVEIEIATASDFQQVVPMFGAIYEGLIPAALEYFDDTNAGKYVVIANQAPRTEEFGPYFSGEALEKSMSLISPIVPTPDFLPMFWYILTHEYLHLWIGHNIQTKDYKRGSWMMEGFTDYVSLKLLHNMGVLPSEYLINGIEMAGNSTGWGENIKKYLAVAGSISMHDAGNQKEENYDMVYSGGSAFALMLDIEMNAVTSGKIGMDHLMRTLNKKFGLRTGGRQIVMDDVQKAINDLCGTNLDHLFDDYVFGTKVIPISEYLNKAGLTIEKAGESDQKISMSPNATEEQKAILKAISGIGQ